MNQNVLSPHEVLEAVATKFDVPYGDLIGRGRGIAVRTARHAAMTLMHEHCDLPLKEIGGYMGGRSHQDVIYATKIVDKLSKADGNLSSRLIAELNRELAEMRKKKSGGSILP